MESDSMSVASSLRTLSGKGVGWSLKVCNCSLVRLSMRVLTGWWMISWMRRGEGLSKKPVISGRKLERLALGSFSQWGEMRGALFL